MIRVRTKKGAAIGEPVAGPKNGVGRGQTLPPDNGMCFA